MWPSKQEQRYSGFRRRHMCFIFALKIYAGKLCFRLRRRIMQRKHMLGMKKNALLLMKNVRWSNLRRLHSLLRKIQLSHGSHSTWGHQAAVIQWLGESLKSTAEFNKSSNLNLSMRKDDSKLIYLCSVLKSTFNTPMSRVTRVWLWKISKTKMIHLHLLL